MKTIVCGVDRSPGGVEALRVASQLSDALGLRLVLVHVAAGYRGTDGRLRAGGRNARQQAERVLEQAAREAGVDGAGDRRAETGDRGSTLARVAAEEAASLLVVGSRGQGRGRRRLLSGLAAELNGTASCPVLVVPPRARR